jgi:hypothetical protein
MHVACVSAYRTSATVSSSRPGAGGAALDAASRRQRETGAARLPLLLDRHIAIDSARRPGRCYGPPNGQ